MLATANKPCSMALFLFKCVYFTLSSEGPRHMMHTLVWIRRMDGCIISGWMDGWAGCGWMDGGWNDGRNDGWNG